MIRTVNASPLVSVIIPTYNKADVIMRAIESVGRQTYRNHEIIVIDDGSTDNTKEVVANLPQLTYFYKENEGPSAARNLGIKKCEGSIIAFLDSDDEWEPDKLEKCLERLNETPRARVVISDYTLYDEGEERERKSPRRLGVYSPLRILMSFNETNLHTSSVVTYKSLVQSVGGFDERLIRGEDWELWIRLAELAEFVFIDEPLVKVHVHPEGLTRISEGEWDNVVRIGIDKALSRRPEIYFPFRAVIFAQYHLKHGQLLHSTRKFAEAADEFLLSLKSAFTFSALFYFLRSLLGRALAGRFRKT
jgi:glycosyltransferase involved in cell wall biosynthesis